ncbi:MAG: alpha/beta fold hydrolase [Afipia sp.]|nr:alpha/beta fold hydrolase [Afipia sp.]
MTKKHVDRRLTAILAADVAGYSRLMGADEEGTHAQLKAHRHDLIDRRIKKHRGRIINTAGDGLLAEFASPVEAVRCAVEIQREMIERNASVPAESRLEFRIGINVGDVIEDGSEIFGDGVNVAARLESIAPCGGVCISRQVLDQIEGKLKLQFRELGRQNLKNIARPIEVFSIDLHDGASKAARILTDANLKQDIRYCKAADGVRLAFAKVGNGPPLLRTAHWLGHLEYDWELPIFRHLLLQLASRFSLVRYDARGNGLSDWDVGNLTLDVWVSDMESVADAAGLERFPILALSQGCAVAVAFAARHPERVSHLILYGGFPVGAYKSPNISAEAREQFDAMRTLMKLGWGSNAPTFRQLFTASMMPDATKEQMDAFNEAQRISASAECAVRYLDTVANFDIQDLLPQVKAPTLVMHVRDDRRVPIASGRDLATGIPGARFVTLPGKNHIPLEQDPGVPILLDEIRRFLGNS